MTAVLTGVATQNITGPLGGREKATQLSVVILEPPEDGAAEVEEVGSLVPSGAAALGRAPPAKHESWQNAAQSVLMPSIPDAGFARSICSQ